VNALRSPTTRRAAFGAWLALTVAYLAWRAAFTLNPDAPAWSGAFLLLEMYAAVCAAAFYATVLERTTRTAPAPVAGFRVDVLVCSYNETIPLVRHTLRRALAMDYPHRTWLLDDGNRPEAKALADELACGYLARRENVNFKAGNLNHALRHTDGDLLVVLDADHLVRRSFLRKLVGYFAEPEVALVQTPQVFYNLDSFQHHFRPRKRRLWHEGAVFHHAMQPGADRFNAAFFVGTGAILRRSAVEAIGGFATGSVTEDAFTSMRLHAAGFRSVYHDEPLGYLLAPESLLQYLTQRLRWGQGSMQILRHESPLTKRGLSWPQRISYFMALSSFAQAVVHLAYFTAPALFLLGGPAPLCVSDPAELAPIVLHVAVDLVAFKLFLGPLARPLLSECYKFLNVYAYLRSLGGFFSSKRLRFEVTNKGRDAGGSIRLLAPQLALLALNATAFAWGVLRVVTAPSPAHALGIAVATGFAGFFVVVGAMAALFAWERMSARTEHAFVAQIPAKVISGRMAAPAVVVRANATSFRAVVGADERAFAVGASASFTLDLREPLVASGTVTAVYDTEPAGDGERTSSIVEVALEPMAAAAEDRLFDVLCEVSLPRIVDGLVSPWSPPSSAEDEERVPSLTGVYYLPVETNVL
jgi:cellulose synthase (UDP-forming)